MAGRGWKEARCLTPNPVFSHRAPSKRGPQWFPEDRVAFYVRRGDLSVRSFAGRPCAGTWRVVGPKCFVILQVQVSGFPLP